MKFNQYLFYLTFDFSFDHALEINLLFGFQCNKLRKYLAYIKMMLKINVTVAKKYVFLKLECKASAPEQAPEFQPKTNFCYTLVLLHVSEYSQID